MKDDRIFLNIVLPKEAFSGLAEDLVNGQEPPVRSWRVACPAAALPTTSEDAGLIPGIVS